MRNAYFFCYGFDRLSIESVSFVSVIKSVGYIGYEMVFFTIIRKYFINYFPNKSLIF